MAQNIYDNEDFFEQFAKLPRSLQGLKGAPEWSTISEMLPCLKGLNIVDLGCGYGWFCRYGLEHGATHILGVDISSRMLEKEQKNLPEKHLTSHIFNMIWRLSN